MNKYLSYLNNYAKYDKIYFQRFFDINFNSNNFINWYKITTCGKLSDNFIEKYSKYIYFIMLPKYQKISQNILNKHYDKFSQFIVDLYLDDKLLFEYEYIPLSQSFIEKNIDKISIKRILNNKLNEDFLGKLILNNKITFQNLLSKYEYCNRLSIDFIKKYLVCDNKCWYYLLYNYCFDEIFLEKYIDKFDEYCWYIISSYQKLSEKFIKKYSHLIEWDQICRNQNLSEQFIEKNIDKINWIQIIQSPYFEKLSKQFILKYINIELKYFVKDQQFIYSNQPSDFMLNLFQISKNKYSFPLVNDITFLKDYNVSLRTLLYTDNKNIIFDKKTLHYIIKKSGMYDEKIYLNNQILTSDDLSFIDKHNIIISYFPSKNHPKISHKSEEWILKNKKYLDIQSLVENNLISNDILLKMTKNVKFKFNISDDYYYYDLFCLIQILQ